MLRTPSFQTKEQYAYETLRKAILSGQLEPGEKLVIDRLSTEMGLSQIPIRAAIQRLQAEGLVVIHPHASAMVASLPPEKIDEIFCLLESLERAAFRSACQKRTEAALEELAELVRQMDEAIQEPDASAWLALNRAFHRRIAAAAGMPLLLDFTNRVLDEWQRISQYYFSNVTSARLPRAQLEHHQILDLLRLRDADALESLAITHNREANLSYQAMLK
ncbi:MAG: GntR family transcriptional regulator [Bacteroidota bacterium]